MQQIVTTLNVLFISRTKNARNDHALPVLFWNPKAGFKRSMYVRRWVGSGKINLFIYSHVVFSGIRCVSKSDRY